MISINIIVQTVGRCHVPQLKNDKNSAFWGEYDKGYYGILLIFLYKTFIAYFSLIFIIKVKYYHSIIKTIMILKMSISFKIVS